MNKEDIWISRIRNFVVRERVTEPVRDTFDNLQRLADQ